MNSKGIEPPESRQITLFEDSKRLIESEIEETQYEIQAHKELVERKCEQIDMLDYLIAKLRERITEKELKRKKNGNDK